MAHLTPISGPIKTQRKRYSTRLDMTPMVDLAFLLLTFFVLTVTLNHAYVMKLQMPEDHISDRSEVNAKQVLTLVLEEKDKVYWYEGVDNPKIGLTNFSANGVRKVLLEKNAQIKKMVVLIKPSSKSRYKNLVDILDEINITKIERYFIVKETPDDHKLIAESQL